MEKKKEKVSNKKIKKTTKKITKKAPVKSAKKKKKGFTLIELLAVIIILGILMIIAIPSVTRYINDSRKSAYVDTAKEIVGGTRNLVNSGKLGMYDTNTTYYIPTSCIKTENSSKSPYGEFTQAYVGVVYDGKGYKYYWISTDDVGQGVPEITKIDNLDTSDIVSDLKDSDILDKVESTGIGNRKEIKIFNCESQNWEIEHQLDDISNNASEDVICKPATSLHKSICYRTMANKGCQAAIGYGNEIEFGTIPNGTPKPGDAYDCKVTANGGYTERFYYIGSSGNNSMLLYYKNMDSRETYSYDYSNQNWHGPVDAYQYLPSTSEWNNFGLIPPGTRQIVAENGQSRTSGGSLPLFTYTDRAARFLTYQEVQSACNKTAVETTGDLEDCNWLFENIGYYELDNGTQIYGYWLENPHYSDTDSAMFINGNLRRVGYNYTIHYVSYGFRPVITIKTNDIEK